MSEGMSNQPTTAYVKRRRRRARVIEPVNRLELEIAATATAVADTLAAQGIIGGSRV